MKLVGSLTSPFVRKVRIVLSEKRIVYDFDVDIPWESDTRVAEHNPLGKVPILIMDDGTTLYDSRVIVDYLDSANPVSRLMPEFNRERSMVKRWEALERERPESLQSTEWISRQQKKAMLGLEVAARDLGDKKWCEGNVYTLADIALGCTLGYLSFRFPEMKWRMFPNLVRLVDALEERTSFIETAPKE